MPRAFRSLVGLGNKRASFNSFPLDESSKRYNVWLQQLNKAGLIENEILLPTAEVPTPNVTPDIMLRGSFEPGLVERIQSLSPWGYCLQVAPDVLTDKQPLLERFIFRSHLIEGAIRQGIYQTGIDASQSSLVDFACNHGYFALLANQIGIKNTKGLDLRNINIEKANFLKKQYNIDNVEFLQQNVYDITEMSDIVLNLGLLYHVTDPFTLVKKTYESCRHFSIIDTITHKSPVSAFIQRSLKNNSHHAEGEYNVEYHPTYHALIDLMHAVGFKNLTEVVPKDSDLRAHNPLYDRFERRCIIGYK